MMDFHIALSSSTGAGNTRAASLRRRRTRRPDFAIWRPSKRRRCLGSACTSGTAWPSPLASALAQHDIALTGTGSIILSDNTANLIEAVSSKDILVNDGDTISGAGAIGGGPSAPDGLALSRERLSKSVGALAALAS